MNKAFKILLGVSAVGLGTIAAVALMKKSKSCSEGTCSLDKKSEEPLKSGLYTKARFKAIAKNLTNNIEEIEDRTSPKNHKKLQKEYESMNWDKN